MDVICTVAELEENLRTFELYLCEGTSEEQQFAHDLIIRGSCFVAYQVDGEMRFAPSRYVGYSHNTIESHLQDQDKDGKETNAAINQTVGYVLRPNEALEGEYQRLSSSLGIEPFNKNRKYWALEGVGIISGLGESEDYEFPEGKLVERKHRTRERNANLVAAAKAAFIAQHGRLFCVACKFDFEKVYGKRGRGYIEVHHTVPVSEMRPGDTTKLEDVAIVCANCHRILHRARPWLRMDELEKLLNG